MPIKDKYFQQIKNGSKIYERRSAHITFVNEKTGEELKREIRNVWIRPYDDEDDPECFERGEPVIVFKLR